MEEKNRAVLLQALSELPQYAPPASLWKSIESEMAFYEREAALRRSVRRLPQYAPPPQVWENIEAEIRRPGLPRIAHRRLLYYRAAAAAALLLGIFGSIWLYQKQQQPQILYTFATETSTTPFIPVALPEDEAAIEEIGAVFTSLQAQYPLPDGARLISELEELNEASQELRITMKKYGFDEHLAQELTRVELQRNQIIQQMAMNL